MWILTVVLLFFGGEAKAYHIDAGPAPTAHHCQAMADDALTLREVGLHIVSATCERAREA